MKVPRLKIHQFVDIEKLLVDRAHNKCLGMESCQRHGCPYFSRWHDTLWKEHFSEMFGSFWTQLNWVIATFQYCWWNVDCPSRRNSPNEGSKRVEEEGANCSISRKCRASVFLHAFGVTFIDYLENDKKNRQRILHNINGGAKESRKDQMSTLVMNKIIYRNRSLVFNITNSFHLFTEILPKCKYMIF